MILKIFLSFAILAISTVSISLPPLNRDKYEQCHSRAAFDVQTNRTPCTVKALIECDTILFSEVEIISAKLSECKESVFNKYCEANVGIDNSYGNCDDNVLTNVNLECAYTYTGSNAIEDYCSCTSTNIQNCINRKINCDVVKSVNAVCATVSNSNNLLSNIFGAPNGLETLGICSIDLLAASLAATLIFPPLAIPVSVLRVACSAKLAGVSIRLLVEAADGICTLASPKLNTSQNELCVFKRARDIKTNYNHKKLGKRSLSDIIKTIRIDTLQEFNKQCKVIAENDVSTIFEKEADLKIITGICKLTTEIHDAYKNLTSSLTNITELPEDTASTTILNPSQKAKL